MNDKKVEVLKPIIQTCGERPQMLQAIEELSELQKALCKFFKVDNCETRENITEEMADVQIMLDQLKIIFNNDEEVSKIETQKIERTYKRMGIETNNEH